ncbi:MAG: hypothetical protein ABIR58_00770 [Gemmatimonadaceae bacterium]
MIKICVTDREQIGRGHPAGYVRLRRAIAMKSPTEVTSTILQRDVASHASSRAGSGAPPGAKTTFAGRKKAGFHYATVRTAFSG